MPIVVFQPVAAVPVVIAAPVKVHPVQPSRALVRTGIGVVPWTMVASVLVALGTLLFVVGRRRRTT